MALSSSPRGDFDGTSARSDSPSASSSSITHRHHSSDSNMSFGERSLSAMGAAVLSAVIVNPLDVAKTRLQAQAAGVPNYPPPQHQFGRRMASLGPNTMFSDFRCSPSCTRSGILGTELFCPPDCFQYKGTLDVFYKVTRQEGFTRLWRGTYAGLALAVPTALS